MDHESLRTVLCGAGPGGMEVKIESMTWCPRQSPLRRHVSFMLADTVSLQLVGKFWELKVVCE